jgi:hypothetical protein
MQIDEISRSTILTFTNHLVLLTQTMKGCSERRPHWLMRLAKEKWPPVILKGTSSFWCNRSGYE